LRAALILTKMTSRISTEWMRRFRRNQLQTAGQDPIADLVRVAVAVVVVVVRVAAAVVVVMVAAGVTAVTAAGMVDAVKSGTAGCELRTGATMKVVALLFCATITTRHTSS
jgi:hypothetical protein